MMLYYPDILQQTVDSYNKNIEQQLKVLEKNNDLFQHIKPNSIQIEVINITPTNTWKIIIKAFFIETQTMYKIGNIIT